MKVLIDGNIILDVLQRRDPHFDASSKIWKLCETDQIEGFISALTFADLVYTLFLKKSDRILFHTFR